MGSWRTRYWRAGGWVVGAGLFLVIGGSVASDVESQRPVLPLDDRTHTETVGDANDQLIQATIDSYQDLNERRARLAARERRPVPNSAIPPRHLDTTNFPDALVDRELIVNGGPPPDGIAPIDAPRFVDAGEVDWLEPDEAVLALIDGDRAHAYPVRILMWHEVVNAEFDGEPVLVTYCPLCGSGVAFDRHLDGEVLDFGTSGSLYQANLVMYDRQTESLWTQVDGRSVVGDLVGRQLDRRALSTVAWSDFLEGHPDGEVLSLETGFDRPYGRNLYASYENRDTPVSGYFTGEADPLLPAFERVVGIGSGDHAVTVVTSELAEVGVTTIDWTPPGPAGSASLEPVPIVVWHADGMTSPLSGPRVPGGAVIGATGAFQSMVDGAATRFRALGDGTFSDEATSSTWNVFGEAIAGPAIGETLEPVPALDTFWFAWATFQPEAVRHDPEVTSRGGT